MFQKAVVRLTFWYLALLMILSIFFSVILYSVSTAELTANQRKLENLLQKGAFLERGQPAFLEFNRAQLDQLEESRKSIQDNLINFNLVVLLAGGGLSYLLARRTLQPIEQAHEDQQRFTADASHELRTPLTAMRTELEVALRDPKLTLEESKQLHKSTLEEIGNLESLSKGLLALAGYDHQGIQKRFQALQVADLIKKAIQRTEKAASAKAITLKVAAENIRVRGDEWALTELIAILLENAVKYSPEKSAVAVKAFPASHGQVVKIRVSDQGVGIKEADLPHIFHRFYRGDQSRTKSSANGYGLGLSIAQKIVDLHEGGIEVSSTEGSGSEFTIILPSKRG
jgi:signal transduction histidine kinase